MYYRLIMDGKEAFKKVAEVISRNQDAAAVLVPKKIALLITNEIYPDNEQDENYDEYYENVVIEQARKRYVKLVSSGGYIGTIMSMPMIVADDSLICALSYEDLSKSSSRLSVDMNEIKRDSTR